MPYFTNEGKLTPAAFWSHGSPFMCSRESESSAYWAKFGREATAHGVKGLVFVGAHWEEINDRIRIGTKIHPNIVQMDMVPREHWENYRINVDLQLSKEVTGLLKEAGFKDVEEDPDFDWHDDTVTPAKWMFPEGTPPAVVVSLNARYNPIFHVKIGRALGKLRSRGILLCGTGGAVHNLYRNNWYPLLTKGDNFQSGRRPAKWALEFEKSVSDVVTNTKGAHLAGALVRLTKDPRYKDAHPTDDHFYPLIVIGAAVSEDDAYGSKRAQTWELQHMCNNQFVWGSWS